MKKEKNKKTLYQLAIPIFVELLFMMMLGLVDTLMLSGYSDNAVGAVSNANTIINFLVVLINVVSVGIGVVISNHLGAGNKEFAKKSIQTGVLFNLTLGFLLMIVFQFAGRLLFKIIDTDEVFLDYSVNYLTIVTLAIPFTATTSVLSASLRSHGHPAHLMIVTIISNIMNVIINYILIYDVFNTNNPVITGVNGAAIATLVSNTFTFLMAIILVKRLIKCQIFSFKINLISLKQIFKIGLPSALENVVYNISQVLVMKVINNLPNGIIAVNARAYVMTLVCFVYQFSNAFANANQILVGYDIGEFKYVDAYKKTYRAYFHSLPYVLGMVLVLNIFSRQLIGILTKDEEIISLACSVMPMVFLLEFGRTINLVFIQSLKAAGDTIYPLVGGIICMLLFASGGSWFFGLFLNMGLVGVFLSYALDESIRGIFMLFRWKSKKWESKSLLKNTKNELLN